MTVPAFARQAAAALPESLRRKADDSLQVPAIYVGVVAVVRWRLAAVLTGNVPSCHVHLPGSVDLASARPGRRESALLDRAVNQELQRPVTLQAAPRAA